MKSEYAQLTSSKHIETMTLKIIKSSDWIPVSNQLIIIPVIGSFCQTGPVYPRAKSCDRIEINKRGK